MFRTRRVQLNGAPAVTGAAGVGMQACLSHTGDVFLPTVQIPLHFPFLEEYKVKHLQQIMRKVDSPQAGCGCLTLRKLDGSGPGETRPRRAALALPSEEPGCRAAHGCAHTPRLVAFTPRGRGGRGLGASRMPAPGCRRVCCQSTSAVTVLFLRVSAWCLPTLPLGPRRGGICCRRCFKV